jgi:hypothetical protein
MDLNAILALVIFGVIPLAILGIIFLVVAYVFSMLRGSARGSVYPTSIVGFPFVIYERVKRHRARAAASSVVAVLLCIFALSFAAQPVMAGMATISLTPADNNVSVMTGVPITMSASGLTASTTYRIYIGDNLHKIISTGTAETTKSFTIQFVSDGTYNVSIRDETGVTYHDSLLMYATNPFGDLLYTMIPLLLGAGAVVILVGGFGLVFAALRVRGR